MKAILLSVQPEWVAKILDGEKTIELRKSVPQGFVGWVYIYCTKAKPYLGYEYVSGEISGYCWSTQDSIDDFDDLQFIANGKVVARFWLDETHKMTFDYYWEEFGTPYEQDTFLEDACLTMDEIIDYGNAELMNHEIKSLYAWHIKCLEIFDKPMELGEFRVERVVYYGDNDESHISFLSLTKAPQSWQYVWVKE